MHQRNGIEGTISELTRAHGMRRNRYRGLAKARFQNLFIATACNIKQWLKLGGAKRDESASYVYVCMYDATLVRPLIQPLLRRLEPLALHDQLADQRGHCKSLAKAHNQLTQNAA